MKRVWWYLLHKACHAHYSWNKFRMPRGKVSYCRGKKMWKRQMYCFAKQAWHTSSVDFQCQSGVQLFLCFPQCNKSVGPLPWGWAWTSKHLCMLWCKVWHHLSARLFVSCTKPGHQSTCVCCGVKFDITCQQDCLYLALNLDIKVPVCAVWCIVWHLMSTRLLSHYAETVHRQQSTCVCRVV